MHNCAKIRIIWVKLIQIDCVEKWYEVVGGGILWQSLRRSNFVITKKPEDVSDLPALKIPQV